MKIAPEELNIMKNSKEYSKKIQNLYRLMKRAYPKIQPVTQENLVQAIVYGIVSEKFSQAATDAAIKNFSEYFVDLNDLRISRTEEIVENLGFPAAQTLGVPATIQSCLQTIFNQHHKLSLDNIKKLGKRQARSMLEKIDGISSFVVDYCMLVSLGGHTIPLTEKMIEYLKRNDLVDANATYEDIAGFLTKQISAKNGYEFYCILRQESETCSIQEELKKHTSVKPVAETKVQVKKTAATEKVKSETTKKNTGKDSAE
jgi:endonuclease III